MGDSTETLLRQWTMLRSIPREPASRATTDLVRTLKAEGFAVTVRTVQRDLIKLMTVFGFTGYTEAGDRMQRWYWPRASRAFDIPGMDPATALVLFMARRHLSEVLPPAALETLAPYFQRSEEVLRQQSKRSLASWADTVRILRRSPVLQPARINPDVQGAIYDGLLRNLQLKAHYKSRGSKRSKETVLHPLALIAKDGVLYLVATAWAYETPYHYALHRFQSAILTSEPSRRPKAFLLDDYLEKEAAFAYPHGKGTLRLEAEFQGQAAQHLLERPLSRDQTSQALGNGRVRIGATVQDTAELRWWLLGLGDNVAVTKPVQLRKEIQARIGAAFARYESDQ